MAKKHTTSDAENAMIRLVAAGFKDQQHTRTANMNRVRAFLKCKLEDGGDFSKVDAKKEEKDYSKKYSDKNLPELIEEMFEKELLNESEKSIFDKLMNISRNAKSLEESFKAPMRVFVSSNMGPLWDDYFFHIRGIAEVLASLLFARIGYCENSKTVSALWRYFGLHVVCPVCTEKIIIQVRTGPDEFKDEERTVSKLTNGEGICPECGKKGIAPRARKGVSLGYNRLLRSLGWTISDVLMKTNSPVYRDIYDAEKARQLAVTFKTGELEERYGSPYKSDSTNLIQGHAHNRALRKMLKIFLQHYYIVSRTIAGLEVSEPFVKAIQGHHDIITWQNVLIANGGDPKTIEELAS